MRGAYLLKEIVGKAGFEGEGLAAFGGHAGLLDDAMRAPADMHVIGLSQQQSEPSDTVQDNPGRQNVSTRTISLQQLTRKLTQALQLATECAHSAKTGLSCSFRAQHICLSTDWQLCVHVTATLRKWPANSAGQQSMQKV